MRKVVFYEDAEFRPSGDLMAKGEHYIDLDEVVEVTVLPDGSKDGGETQEERFRNKILTDLTTALGPTGGWREDMVARVKEALGMPLVAEEAAIVAEDQRDVSYDAYIARVTPRLNALRDRWLAQGLIT